MKKTFCAFLLLVSIRAVAISDSLGLPGDNLDLSAVLELFKKSESPEQFEKALNKEDNKINNLDLNGDGEIDYIRVVDRSKNDAHALVLQVPVNEAEVQDVAVIGIEKSGNENVNVQIIGDEDLYGKNYIIEPAPENENDKSASVNKTTIIVNVWHWSSVRYIYRPAYTVWVSPWGWRHYPLWWKPWKPVHWHVYHPHWHQHRIYHRRVHTHRVQKAHNVYYGHRTVSKTVSHRQNISSTKKVNKTAGKDQPQVKQKSRNSGKVQGTKSGRQNKQGKEAKQARQGKRGNKGGQHPGKRK